MSRLSTSSWSLHRALGRPPLWGPDTPPPVTQTNEPASVTLLELPARLAQLGVHTLEIVHFHFPNTEAAFLADLRAALAESGVELFSILIDAGDITHPDEAKRAEHLAWIRNWIEIAARCGASHARVIAGYSQVDTLSANLHDNPTLQRSATHLCQLADFAASHGVRVITENFRETASQPESVLTLLELCEGKVGLCADFGNFKGPHKHLDLAAIFPRADSAHVKANYDINGVLDMGELKQGMDHLAATGFDGPLSLIFDAPLRGHETEWDNLVALRECIIPYVGVKA